VGRIDCHHSSHSLKEKESKRAGGGLVGDIGVGMYNTMARSKSHHKEDTDQERSHSKERRYNGGERPHSTGERPHSTGERPHSTGERPHSTGERTYSGERVHSGGERGYASDRPHSTGERSYAGDRAHSAGEKPKERTHREHSGERPREHSGERPSHREHSGERPSHRDRSGERTCGERIRRENSGDKIRSGGERVRRDNSGELGTIVRREAPDERVQHDKRSHSLVSTSSSYNDQSLPYLSRKRLGRRRIIKVYRGTNQLSQKGFVEGTTEVLSFRNRREKDVLGLGEESHPFRERILSVYNKVYP
jgi:hypothetical protein